MGPGLPRQPGGVRGGINRAAPLLTITPMPRYCDPDQAPDPQAWLALDEAVRMAQAEVFHKHKRIRLPGLKAYAALHAIVENQIAGDLGAAVRAVPRLMAQGLRD